MKTMTKWERVEAAIHGGEVDRLPISLWKHYHLQDRAPGLLAEVTLAFHRRFDTDLIKHTPSGLYPIQDWGATIRFGADDDTAPDVVEPVIQRADLWPTLPRLDPSKGALRRELEALHLVAKGLDGSAPFMMTIFSPLTIAQKLRGPDLIQDLRQSPRHLHTGLRLIRDVVRSYVVACHEAGAPGFFFATQLATHTILTEAEYQEFGVAYDLDVLETMQEFSRVTMLHVCRDHIMFDLVAGYPVHLINWSDRAGGPSLAAARKVTDTALAGGLSLATLEQGTTAEVTGEVHDAVVQAGSKGFMLAPACVIPGPTPDANLDAVRAALN